MVLVNAAPASRGAERVKTTCIALLRGVNVGKAKRVVMAEFRALLEDLGHSRVRTILNSGNAIFETTRPDPAKAARAIEAAIRRRLGFPAHTIVITAADLDAIVAGNPFEVRDPSTLLVAFVGDERVLKKISPLAGRPWRSEAISIGRNAAYVSHGRGIARSKIFPAIAAAAEGAVTTRNWATVLKLQSAAGG